MKERLYKSTSDRMLSGVSGGLAEYLDVDSTLVRIAWVIVAIMSAGVGLLAYIALVIIVPTRFSPPSSEPSEEQAQFDGETSADRESPPAFERNHAESHKRRRSLVIGFVLVVIGGMALGYNFDLFEWLDWGKFWPALLILLGVLLIARRFERS